MTTTSRSSSESVPSGPRRSARGKKNAESVSALISRFAAEPTWTKAFLMLVDGRVRVTFVANNVIHATVTGDNGEYFVDYGLTRAERWHCSCPARVDCSHMRAVQQVTTVRGME